MKRKRPVQAGGRTLEFLHDRGYHADKVEQWVPRPEGKGQRAKFAGGFRRDAFGFMDVVAFRPAERSLLCPQPVTLAVQCTTKQQITNHLRAYRRDPVVRQRILDWLACGCAFVIHGWWKETVLNKSNSGTHPRWRLEERQVT